MSCSNQRKNTLATVLDNRHYLKLSNRFLQDNETATATGHVLGFSHLSFDTYPSGSCGSVMLCQIKLNHRIPLKDPPHFHTNTTNSLRGLSTKVTL